MRLRTDLILASGSPRRKYLLELLGLSFRVHVSDVDESIDPATPPAAMVEALAQRKAEAISATHPNALTLAADTIVVLGTEILGKPEDEEEAAHMLRCLSGQTHTVYTGIALHHPPSERYIAAHEATDVTFATMSEAEIAAYVANGSPMDKAGAYGIQDDQGALYIERIDGDYYCVMGLPLHRLYTVLKTHFADLLSIAPTPQEISS